MSSIGSPIDASLLQTAQAQHVASRKRDAEKAGDDASKRFVDQLDRRVAGVEDVNAVRGLPENDSEQAEQEHEAQPEPQSNDDTDDGDDQTQPRIDLRA